ncbi:MAG: hypothetical protein DRO40_07655 [Thermoprotei archaeon]|nr:MAG: hypothetical protein DRO40_07655 [Thermoprotei archaeon]
MASETVLKNLTDNNLYSENSITGQIYHPLNFDSEKYNEIYSRSKFGWSKWLEQYKRDELIFRLSFNIIRELKGYSQAVKYSKYLKALSRQCIAIRGRGSDPRALASAIAYYVLTVFGNEDISLNTFFKWSSKASVYRALKSVTNLIGHGELFYKLLLSSIRKCNPRSYGDRLYFPILCLLVFRDSKSLLVLSERIFRGYVRVNRGVNVEGFLIHEDYIRRYNVMNSVELKFRFRVLDLLEMLKKNIGYVFTARDVAELLCTDSQYAGRLLSLLVKGGFLEIVEEKPVRKYRVRDY